MTSKSIELNKCCISKKSSSPFKRSISEEIRSSTKSSNVLIKEYTIKNLFLLLLAF